MAFRTWSEWVPEQRPFSGEKSLYFWAFKAKFHTGCNIFWVCCLLPTACLQTTTDASFTPAGEGRCHYETFCKVFQVILYYTRCILGLRSQICRFLAHQRRRIPGQGRTRRRGHHLDAVTPDMVEKYVLVVL